MYPEQQQEATAGPVILDLSTVTPQKVQWLWPGRIPLGKLTLLFGDPCLGKSFITLDIASRVSCGLPWPDNTLGSNPPGTVILLSAEDDVADTIVPRLNAACADLSKIRALQAVRHLTPGESPKDAPFCLSTDIPILRHTLSESPGCRLVIVDPLSAFLGKTDSHVNAEVRAILAPLSELAAEFGVAVLCVTHLNKASGGKAMYRATGSLAFIAAARAAWAVVADKADPARRLVLCAKNNLSREQSGLAYSIVQAPSDPDMAVVSWEADTVSMTADDGMKETGDERSELDDAKDWLLDKLNTGAALASEIRAEATAAGFSWGTLRRAKDALGVRIRREGFGGKGRFWWGMQDDRCAIDAQDHNMRTNEFYDDDCASMEDIGAQNPIGAHVRKGGTPEHLCGHNGDGHGGRM